MQQTQYADKIVPPIEVKWSNDKLSEWDILKSSHLTLAFSNSLVRAASGCKVKICVWLRNMSL